MVADNAERVLNDTSYDRLRTPRALRLLSAAYIVVTIAIPVCWIIFGAIAGIAAILAGIVVYLLLRVAVRAVADLPDDVLDERLRRDRDRVYVHAFRVVSTVAFVAANIAFISVEFSNTNTTITLDQNDVAAIYWTLLALILGVPSVVLALTRAQDGTEA
jgi:hypothetical protein